MGGVSFQYGDDSFSGTSKTSELLWEPFQEWDLVV